MRDMTRKQFENALTRHGFQQEPFPLWFRDTTGALPNTCIGAIVWLDTGKIDRRATIAHLIRYREKQSKQLIAPVGA